MPVADALHGFLGKLCEAYAAVTCDDMDECNAIMASLQMGFILLYFT